MRYRLVRKERYGPEGLTRIVIISDEDAIGRSGVSDDGEVVLRVPEFLAEGELVGDEEAIQALSSADVAVLYGENITELAVRLGYASADSVLDVKGLKHVQIFKIMY
ncbi:MAG: DUF424 family protein [Desulfurococcales archaeon]|nr:DUF424 family protein [Desulfurococcales archaeon]